MKVLPLVRTLSCISLLINFLLPFSLFAQTFTPIIGDYKCAEFPDGSKYLVKTTSTGFVLVKTADVKKKYKKDHRLYKQRLKKSMSCLRTLKKQELRKEN